MTNETMKEIEFFQRNKKTLESIFSIKLPELDLNSPDLINDLIKYQTIFDVYDSVAAFKEANGRGEAGLMDAFNTGTAAYIEGKIISFDERNYDKQNETSYEDERE